MGGGISKVAVLTPLMFFAISSLHGLDARMKDPPKPEPVIETTVDPICRFEDGGFEVRRTKDGFTTTSTRSIVHIDYVGWAGHATPFFALRGFFNVYPRAPYERFFVPDRMNSSVARYDVPGYAQLVLTRLPNGWVLDSYATCPNAKEWR